MSINQGMVKITCILILTSLLVGCSKTEGFRNSKLESQTVAENKMTDLYDENETPLAEENSEDFSDVEITQEDSSAQPGLADVTSVNSVENLLSKYESVTIYSISKEDGTEAYPSAYYKIGDVICYYDSIPRILDAETFYLGFGMYGSVPFYKSITDDYCVMANSRYDISTLSPQIFQFLALDPELEGKTYNITWEEPFESKIIMNLEVDTEEGPMTAEYTLDAASMEIQYFRLMKDNEELAARRVEMKGEKVGLEAFEAWNNVSDISIRYIHTEKTRPTPHFSVPIGWNLEFFDDKTQFYYSDETLANLLEGYSSNSGTRTYLVKAEESTTELVSMDGNYFYARFLENTDPRVVVERNGTNLAAYWHSEYNGNVDEKQKNLCFIGDHYFEYAKHEYPLEAPDGMVEITGSVDFINMRVFSDGRGDINPYCDSDGSPFVCGDFVYMLQAMPWMTPDEIIFTDVADEEYYHVTFKYYSDEGEGDRDFGIYTLRKDNLGMIERYDRREDSFYHLKFSPLGRNPEEDLSSWTNLGKIILHIDQEGTDKTHEFMIPEGWELYLEFSDKMPRYYYLNAEQTHPISNGSISLGGKNTLDVWAAETQQILIDAIKRKCSIAELLDSHDYVTLYYDQNTDELEKFWGEIYCKSNGEIYRVESNNWLNPNIDPQEKYITLAHGNEYMWISEDFQHLSILEENQAENNRLFRDFFFYVNNYGMSELLWDECVIAPTLTGDCIEVFIPLEVQEGMQYDSYRVYLRVDYDTLEPLLLENEFYVPEYSGWRTYGPYNISYDEQSEMFGLAQGFRHTKDERNIRYHFIRDGKEVVNEEVWFPKSLSFDIFPGHFDEETGRGESYRIFGDGALENDLSEQLALGNIDWPEEVWIEIYPD